jgi:hypothetical protein
MNTESDRQLAIDLRDEGMARAKSHADVVYENWSACAYAALIRYVGVHLDDFTAEDVREWAIDVPEPPDRRAWGSVLLKGSRDRIIRRAGYRPHRDPVRHHGISTVWRRA